MKQKFKILSLFLLSLFVLTSCFNSNNPQSTVITKDIVEVEEIVSDTTALYETLEPGCVGVYVRTENSAGVGSGFIYKKVNNEYYVITNHHVIENQIKTQIYVGNNLYYDATVIGSDSKNDVAVVKFSTDVLHSTKNLYVNDIYNYDEFITIPGQTVIAIGCPLSLSNYNTITKGIVSRVDLNEIIIDAVVNPGNSGCAIFNAKGQVIGILKSKDVWSSAEGQQVAVGGQAHVIPLATVKKCAADIEATGSNVTRPLLGMTVTSFNVFIESTSYDELIQYIPDGTDRYAFLIVTAINENSVAQASGLMIGDVILECNDRDIYSSIEMSSIMNTILFTDTLNMKIYRKSANQTIDLDINFS